MYGCANCGAGLRFDIRSQKMKCDHCGSAFAVKDLGDQSLKQNEYEANVFECSQCGGEIVTQENDMTGRCCYCGSTQVFAKRVERLERPKWIAPFRRDAESCKSTYRQAVSKAFFAPKEIRSAEYVDSIRGVYMPYWLYESIYDKGFVASGQASKKTKFTDLKIITEKDRINARFRARFTAMQQDASSWYWDEISDNMVPYNLTESSGGLAEFSPAYLCGFYGETADVPKPEKKLVKGYEEEVEKRAEYSVYASLKQSYGLYDGVDHVRRPNQADFVIGLLPVWFLSYRHGNRVSYSVINGQSGQLAAEFPVDLRKFLACTAGLAVILYLLLNLFWVMRPEYVALAAAIGAEWAVLFGCRDLNEIARKECEMLPAERHKSVVKPRRDLYGFSNKQFIPYGLILLLVFCENAGYIDRHPRGLMTWIPLMFTIWSLVWASWYMKKYFASTRHYVRLNGRAFEGNILAYLSIVIALVVQILRPVSDYVYYGVGFLCMAMTLASMIGVVLSYNRMASRPMPQFEHMGGKDYGKKH